MKPSLVERDVPMLDTNAFHVFGKTLHGAGFLLPWAYMDPSVYSRSWQGPSWTFEHKGRQAVATIPLTATLHTGEVQYWDAVDTRRGTPVSVGVKRAHATADGMVLRVFDEHFIEDHLVELRNRQTGYFLLVNAHPIALARCEARVLDAVTQEGATLAQLTEQLEFRDDMVRAAVMNLWRTGRVDVPVESKLLGPRWTVRRRQHA